MALKLLTKADFPRLKQMHESGMKYKEMAETLAKEGYVSRKGTPLKMDRVCKYMRGQKYYPRCVPEGTRKNHYIDAKTRRKLERQQRKLEHQQRNPQLPLPFMSVPQEPQASVAQQSPASVESALQEIGAIANSDLPQNLKMKYIAQLTQSKA